MIALWMAWFMWMGCSTGEHPAPIRGTTYRIDEDVWDPDSELFLDILTTENDCRKVVDNLDELAVCRPFVDRAHAEVHVAFQFLDRTNTQQYPVALTQERDQMVVLHDSTDQSDYEIIPHNPRDSGQLYVVLIDGSGSMYENDGERMKKVKRALLLDEVLDAFFPSRDSKTGVMLLTFTDNLVSIDGGAPRILRGRGAYKKMVEEHLGSVPPGYTYLFKAVRLAMTDIMKLPNVRKFLATRSARPTVIALTDGFNNEAASDTCSTNVNRLKQTLETIREARGKRGSVKPFLFTVGLGEKYRNGDKSEKANARLTAKTLCGRYANSRIDGALERQGIDHYSLAWLAEAGGGVSFVKQNPRGLAEVFLAAAAKRYEWFELKYKLEDNLYHRKSFDLELRLQQGFQASSTVRLFPSPWLDAPTAHLAKGERWVRPTSLCATLTLLMPILGILVFLNYLPAAWFNVRRAVFRRAKPRKDGTPRR